MRPNLAAIRERAEKAMKGPWAAMRQDACQLEITAIDGFLQLFSTNGNLPNEADFAAHAREDIPALLAHIDALESLVREYQPGHKCSCDYLRTHGELLSRVCDCGLAARLAELGIDK